MMENTNVTAKEYRKMQKFLLLIAGCIAIDQTLLSIVILLSLLMGLQIAWKERGISQMRVWPRHLKWLLLLLLATGYISLHNPLVTKPFDCTFNFFYVVGQYVSVVWLVTRFGNCFAGKSRFAFYASAFSRAHAAGPGMGSCCIRPDWDRTALFWRRYRCVMG